MGWRPSDLMARWGRWETGSRINLVGLVCGFLLWLALVVWLLVSGQALVGSVLLAMLAGALAIARAVTRS